MDAFSTCDHKSQSVDKPLFWFPASTVIGNMYFKYYYDSECMNVIWFACENVEVHVIKIVSHSKKITSTTNNQFHWTPEIKLVPF